MNRAEVIAIIDRTLTESGLEFGRREDRHFIVDLPGEHKLKTTCLLTVGDHGVAVQAFVCRKPDENAAGVHEWLLRRNRKLFGVHYTIDNVGDIYLVGQMSAASVTADEIDRVLGQVLTTADSDFNVLVELGFAESIKREWDWRVKRGEPLRNLEPFRHLIRRQEDESSIAATKERGAEMRTGRPDTRRQEDESSIAATKERGAEMRTGRPDTAGDEQGGTSTE